MAIEEESSVWFYVSKGRKRFLISTSDYDRVQRHDAEVGWTVKFVGGKDRVWDKTGSSIGRVLLGVARHERVYHLNKDGLDARRCNLSLHPTELVQPDVAKPSVDTITVDGRRLEVLVHEIAEKYLKAMGEVYRLASQEQEQELNELRALVAPLAQRVFGNLPTPPANPAPLDAADRKLSLWIRDMSEELSELFMNNREQFTSQKDEVAF